MLCSERLYLYRLFTTNTPVDPIFTLGNRRKKVYKLSGPSTLRSTVDFKPDSEISVITVNRVARRTYPRQFPNGWNPRLRKLSFTSCHTNSFITRPYSTAEQRAIHEPGKYTCEYSDCGRTYTNQFNLSRHVSTIHNGTKYTCRYPDCGKFYSQKSFLSQHIDTIHKGVKYKCAYHGCGKVFTQKFYLGLHVKAVHEGVTHRCDFPSCDQVYSLRQNLLRHIKQKHSDEC